MSDIFRQLERGMDRFITLEHRTGCITIDRADVRRVEVKWSGERAFPRLVVEYGDCVAEFAATDLPAGPKRLKRCRRAHDAILDAMGMTGHQYVQIRKIYRIADDN